MLSVQVQGAEALPKLLLRARGLLRHLPGVSWLVCKGRCWGRSLLLPAPGENAGSAGISSWCLCSQGAPALPKRGAPHSTGHGDGACGGGGTATM